MAPSKPAGQVAPRIIAALLASVNRPLEVPRQSVLTPQAQAVRELPVPQRVQAEEWWERERELAQQVEVLAIAQEAWSLPPRGEPEALLVLERA